MSFVFGMGGLLVGYWSDVRTQVENCQSLEVELGAWRAREEVLVLMLTEEMEVEALSSQPSRGCCRHKQASPLAGLYDGYVVWYMRTCSVNFSVCW